MNDTFATRLKGLRKNANLTQIELAKKFNIANGTVGNWESGNRQPDYAMLQKIADFFNVSVDYLLGGYNDVSGVPYEMGEVTEEIDIKKSPSVDITEGEQKLLDLFRKVPENQQQMVLQMIEVALKSLE